MHTVPASATSPPPHTVTGGQTTLAHFIARIRRLGVAWVARRRATRDLETLFERSDYELRDLGISRGDFQAILNGTFRRD